MTQDQTIALLRSDLDRAIKFNLATNNAIGQILLVLSDLLERMPKEGLGDAELTFYEACRLTKELTKLNAEQFGVEISDASTSSLP